jgi:hypothetical protein
MTENFICIWHFIPNYAKYLNGLVRFLLWTKPFISFRGNLKINTDKIAKRFRH